MEVEYALSALAASASGGNKTSEAIQAAFPGRRYRLAAEIPFSSVRKWSAALFADNDIDEEAKEQRLNGIYALGAPELLRRYLRNDTSRAGRSEPGLRQWQTIDQLVDALTLQGLRVLLLAHAPDARLLEDRGEDSLLPSNMAPLGI